MGGKVMAMASRFPMEYPWTMISYPPVGEPQTLPSSPLRRKSPVHAGGYVMLKISGGS